MNRDMQIAKAVREKLMVSLVEQDLAYGVSKATLACFVVNITRDVDLPAIITSVPTPKPYCWVAQGCSVPFYGEFAKFDAERESAYVGGTCKAFPLYAAPQPPAEPVNARLLEALTGLVDDIQGLMSESYGVTGLHLNGDVAGWFDLEAGGRFERLTYLPVAIAVIAAAEKEIK